MKEEHTVSIPGEPVTGVWGARHKDRVAYFRWGSREVAEHNFRVHFSAPSLDKFWAAHAGTQRVSQSGPNPIDYLGEWTPAPGG